jgi:YesN/AraC family two-component response regulator
MFPSSPFRVFTHKIQGHLELHWHEFYELSFIISGEGIHVLNGISQSMKRGHLFLLTPADFHEMYVEEGTTVELYNVIFSEEMLKKELYEILFSYMDDGKVVIEPENIRYIENEFIRLWSEEHKNNIGQKLMIQNSLERILIELIRRCRGKKDTNNSMRIDFEKQEINKILAYIQHHFREPLTLEQVAKQAQLSPNYFSKYFRKATGLVFQSYLQGLRLQFAKSLIKSSNLPITEVCHASGFNTLSHFNRSFKKKYQKSPKAYRK